MRKSLSNQALPVFLGTHTNQTRPAAALLVGTNCGKFLCVKRSAGNETGKWGILGGMVDPGETPEMAALREAIEEGEFRPENDIFYFDKFIAKSWYYPETPVHIFSTRIAEPIDIVLNEEHSDYDWVSQHQWPNPATRMMKFIMNKHGANLHNSLLLERYL